MTGEIVMEFIDNVPVFWWWLIAAVLLAILETMTGTLYLICFSLGGLAGGLVSFGSESVLIQFGAFAVVSFGTIFWLPRFAKSGGGESRGAGADSLVGEAGVVLEAFESADGSGMVKIRGQSWRAESKGPLPAGSRIIVNRIVGNRLEVCPDLRSGDED